jgi:hypothetical protein
MAIEGNIVKGAFRDAITVDDDSSSENVDVGPGNVVTGYKDDGIEAKGGVNVRFWGNLLEIQSASFGETFFAANVNDKTHVYGPVYIFRNSGFANNIGAGGATTFKLGCSSGNCPTMNESQPIFIFHNSFKTDGAGANFDGFVCGNEHVTARNNIWLTRDGVPLYYCADGDTFDYEVAYQSLNSNNWAKYWNGSATYASLASFQAGTGQELHSKQQNPGFTNGAQFPSATLLMLTIDNTSPAFAAGTPLDNFNGPSTLWPYSGAGPDIGAYQTP